MKKNNAVLLRLVALMMIMTVLSCSKTLLDRHSKDTDSPSASGFYQNEIKPVPYKLCFEGAYYRKLVSGTDVWRGINRRLVLPKLHFDEQRMACPSVSNFELKATAEDRALGAEKISISGNGF